MKTKLYLVPAYGRKVRSSGCLKSLWKEGKDFRILGTSTYCSIQDLTELEDYDMIILQDLAGNHQITVKNRCLNPLDNWL